MRIIPKELRKEFPQEDKTPIRGTNERVSLILSEIARVQRNRPNRRSAQEQALDELEEGIIYPFNTIPFQLITNSLENDSVFFIRGYRRLSYEPVRFLSASSSYFRVIHVNEQTEMAHLELLFSSIDPTGVMDSQNFETYDNVSFRRTGIFVSVDLREFIGVVCLPAVYAEEASTTII